MYHHTVGAVAECQNNSQYLKISLLISLLIYDLQSKDWINAYYMLKRFLKAHMPPKVSNEMKCTNEKMI